MAFLIAYPETVQFRQIVTYVEKHMSSAVDDQPIKLPTLKFTGTVKLHGTNAAIGYQRDIGYWYQSRNRVLTRNNDNAGVFECMYPLSETFFSDHCPTLQQYSEQGSTVIIYGEWCGSNIQGAANVAITGLKKIFVIFKVKIINQVEATQRNKTNVEERYKTSPNGYWLDPEEWKDIKWHEQSIYNIFDFPTYEIDINFNNPESSQDILTQMTDTVERQCPVGAYFNRSGCGEGIVWTEWKETHGTLLFKVKGRQHRIINSKTLVPIRPVVCTSAQDFIEYSCTINRMEQAYNCIYEELRSIEKKDFNRFVRWLTEDIIKEEKDTMDIAHVDAKNLTHLITNKTQKWFNYRLTNSRKIKRKRN